MLQSSISQFADTLAAALAPLREPLSAEHLIGLARRRTGLTEFGETSFLGPLQKFLGACCEEADLSLFGRIATRWDVIRFLSNLLRLCDEEARAPEILRQPINKPIFISGL